MTKKVEDEEGESMVTETIRGVRTDDLSYVLLVIKGAKLQEKEVELPRV